jgi:hypothetical protein
MSQNEGCNFLGVTIVVSGVTDLSEEETEFPFLIRAPNFHIELYTENHVVDSEDG